MTTILNKQIVEIILSIQGVVLLYVMFAKFAKDRNEISAPFNICIDVNSTRTNFDLPGGRANISNDLLTTSYTYALLSQHNWQKIAQDQKITSELEQKYQVLLENKNQVVLLILK